MNEHAAMVEQLCKPGIDISEELSGEDAHLLHMALGLAGEVGELIDAVKKAVIYGRALDLANVVEELGDIEFYLEGFRQGLDLSREHCLAENVRKLRIRYGDKFTNEAAQKRADKS